MIDLLREKGIDIADRHMDCGIEIFDAEAQDTHAGGSGCGCSAVTLAAYVLPKLESGEWKKVLFLPTGALLSKTSFNEGKSVPGDRTCGSIGESGGEIGKSSRSEMKHTLASAVSYW